MSLSELLSACCSRATFSIELCPSSALNLKKTLSVLKTSRCDFVSVVWLGKQSKIQEKAFALCGKLLAAKHVVLLHLAGKDLSYSECLEICLKAKEIGVKNLFALQGDPLRITHKGDFPFAADLVAFIRKNFGNYFAIGVAGYPQNADEYRSILHLKYKVDAGADFIITQATFEYKTIEKFQQQCQHFAIYKPVICGLFAMNSYKTFELITKQCNIRVPNVIRHVVSQNLRNEVLIHNFGMRLVVDIARNILWDISKNACLISGLHVFCLNNVIFFEEISDYLGINLHIIRPIQTLNDDSDTITHNSIS